MRPALWTSKEIEAATGGRAVGAPFAAGGVSIDTRTIAPRDLFVALEGDRDGHDFLAAAFEAGAVGGLARREGSGPCVIVDDTLEALVKLGQAARQRASLARRGAVTGSVGKTSVSQVILAGLRRAGPAHGPAQSYNNHIGVPLTLARMPASTHRAVFEIGMNHAGEIAPLTRMVCPHAAAVTSVGPVHVENFADGERGVAAAKAEIFEGLEEGGVAVLPADSPWFGFLAAKARGRGAMVRGFGAGDGAQARLEAFVPTGAGAVVKAKIEGQAIQFPIRQSGAHWGPMSLCALLMLEALDVDRREALAALSEFEALEGRGAERKVAIEGGAFTLVDESYNANPVSMSAALATLAARPGSGRKIVALTDMLELGETEMLAHAALVGPIEAAGVDQVYCAGPLMERLWRALPPARRGGYARCAVDLAPRLVAAVEPGDVVMVKGSKGSKAWALRAALAALDASGAEGG
jgi:UDP-N-acetylmuramoyl-tripeptide--D-alanyl-D-alanine ligase